MKKLILPVILVIIFLFTGCAGNLPDNIPSSEESSFSEEASSEEITTAPLSDMFSSRDSDTSFSEKTVNITLSDSGVSYDSDSVSVSDGKILLKEEATYIFSGTLSDGSIIVDAPDTAKLQIVLSGADITSKSFAALYVLSCDKVFLTLDENTENSLINGGEFTQIDENNVDGAVFSKQDLTINGRGKLTVSSPSAHSVVCKDDLVITGGDIVLESASHGMDVNDSVRIKDSSLLIEAGKDGIHCENEDNAEKGFIFIESGKFDINSEGDGISAGTTMEILGGEFNILTGGGFENAEIKTSENWGGFRGGKGDMGKREPVNAMGQPETGMERPEMGMERPEMGTERPEMGMERPEMGMGRQNTPTSIPEEPSDMSFVSGEDAFTEDTASDSESIKGIKAGASLYISGGTFSINSADDGIHSDSDINISGGEFFVKTGDDGVHAENTLFFSGGEIDISESYEGLEALHIKLTGGMADIVSSDDGLNAAGGTDSSGFGGFRGGDMFGGGMSAGNGSILISGGTVFINASGDGIDANGTLEITGGEITVTGPTVGDTATLDYDRSAVISGGTFIGTGASGMAQTFSDSAQGVISVSVGNCSAGTKITLKNSNGDALIESTPSLSFAVVILSSPDIVKGEEYILEIGSLSEKINAK